MKRQLRNRNSHRAVRRGEVTASLNQISSGIAAGLAAALHFEGPVPLMPAFAPTLEFPLRGAWAVVRSPGHHRYAFDFAAVSTPAGGYFRKPLLSLLWSGASVEDSH